MAKTYKDLFPCIVDFENLYRAFLAARRNKRYRTEVLSFTSNLEENLIQLQNELLSGTYRTGPYRFFKVYEPKERVVAALSFRDRVVQHAIMAIIEPVWEPRFIFDSYACRVGKGAHAGADRIQYLIRRVRRTHGVSCVLKGDVAKYFPSIDHGILKRLIRRRIACSRTLSLLDEIIDSTAVIGDLAPKGLPIGNLTSQLFANIYLHELDMFVKHGLRERFYVRYMDDFVVVHHDKAHLHLVRRRIEEFLWDQLRLLTNRKTQVFPVQIHNGRALDFLGYRIWPSHRRLRKDSVKRMQRKLIKLEKAYACGLIDLNRISASIQSWLSHAGHADTYHLRSKLLGSVSFQRHIEFQ
jgi:retron-type reverse transcriptase